jgi:hypothetical protein
MAALSGSSEAARCDARLPLGWSVRRTRKAILAMHPALKAAWGRHLGYSLMYKESEVLVAVLETLMERNIPALGLHDGLLVAQSKAEEASAVMMDKAGRDWGWAYPCK